jgi:MtN3 and saliva related transmembrane protein
MVQLIGFAAAVIGALAFLPQVVKTWRTRSTGDLSLGMLVALATSTALWVTYGVSIGSAPVAVGNAITFTLASSLVVLKIRGDSARA